MRVEGEKRRYMKDEGVKNGEEFGRGGEEYDGSNPTCCFSASVPELFLSG